MRLAGRPPTVQLCGIVNAKSGLCTEDCRFCAQSAHNHAAVNCYDLMGVERLVAESETAARNGAGRFSIVTSGHRVEDEGEIDTIVRAVAVIRNKGILPCASLGNISKETMGRLSDAGLTRYHCNLETARSFYGTICTTRDWQESVDTIRTAKELGLATCSGGLFGLGETDDQRVELLDAIRTLDVDSVPINFFHPVEGTQVTLDPTLTPLVCLKIVAVARLMMPDKEIRVCGGREYHLRELQPLLLFAGADALMVGGYLTTRGRSVQTDLSMIADAGFTVAPAGC